MLNRFIDKHGYNILETIPQDASNRQYYRVGKGERTAMVMQCDPSETREGYRMSDFIRVANWLNEIGLNAPDIYEVDEDQHLMLLQDLGRTDFKAAMAAGHDKADLYTLAHDVLVHLQDKRPPFQLRHYNESDIHHLHRDVVTWYLPAVGVEVHDDLVEEYWRIWEGIEKSLAPCPQGFQHIDYHVENLIVCPDEKGLKQCGLLDFQAAMIGPQPYDLVNLLEDARADIPSDMTADILTHYDDNYKSWLRVLGTQFHCRVIGLFVKLPATQGKMKYLEHIPRLQGYLAAGLQDPVLSPVKSFFDALGVDFSDPNSMNIENIHQYNATKT